MNPSRKTASLAAFFVMLVASASSYAEIRVIDFDFAPDGSAIVNGEEINSQYDAWGLNIESCLIDGNVASGTNQETGVCGTPDNLTDRQIAFDTGLTGTRDPDLEVTRNGFNSDGSRRFVSADGQVYEGLTDRQTYYDNLADNYTANYTDQELEERRLAWDNPGNVLILNEENSVSTCNNGVCTNPDDEGSRPAGFFKFVFTDPVDILSIDFFDIESDESNAGRPDNTIFFSIAGQSGEADSIIEYTVPNTNGDRFKRIRDDVYANLYNVTSIVLNMPGSGAIDNLVFRSNSLGTTNVSAPAAPILLALATFFLLRTRKQLNS